MERDALDLYVPHTIGDILNLRRVRNACREFMTRDTRRIGLVAQWRWWRTRSGRMLHHQRRYRPYLLRLRKQVIGYGMITDNAWLSGGLLPAWRGKGYGRPLFVGLMARCLSPKLEVRQTNTIAHSLYRSLGFVETGRQDGILRMELSSD